MYRPNRVGTYHLVNPQAAPRVITQVELDSSLVTWIGFRPIIKSTTIRENFDTTNFQISAKTIAATTTVRSWGLGVAAGGVNQKPDNTMFVNISGSIWIHVDDAIPISIQPVIGKWVAAAPIVGAIPFWQPIPARINQLFHLGGAGEEDKTIVQCSWNETVLMGDLDGSVAVPSEFPIFGGVKINFEHAGTHTIDMEASCSIHVYRQDMETIDPTR